MLVSGNYRAATKCISSSHGGQALDFLLLCWICQVCALLKQFQKYCSSTNFRWLFLLLFRSSWKWLMIVVWMQKPQVGLVVSYYTEGYFRREYHFIWYLCYLCTRLTKPLGVWGLNLSAGLNFQGIKSLAVFSSEECSWSHQPGASGWPVCMAVCPVTQYTC